MARLNDMRTFVTVVAEGSFTRAARRLGLSPQLVSKYVAQLEEHLGVRLLHRTTRRLHLTEAGTVYFQRAEQVLAEIEDMEGQLADLQSQARGRLRISAPVSFAIRHLVPLINAFQRAHPAVDVDLQLNDRKVDIVEEGFDIALRIGSPKKTSLMAQYIVAVRLLLCASPDYLREHGTPERPQDLAGHRFLCYSYMEESHEALLKWLWNSSAGERGRLVSNNAEVLMEAAVNGASIVLLPTFLAGDAIRQGRLKPVLTEHEPEPLGLYALFAHDQLLASKVRHFVDFLEGYFDAPPVWDRF